MAEGVSLPESVDCLVVGGGPAGLTAAIYLTRFHLTAQVIDSGESRAGMIPKTHNHAGFPDGISGRDLLSRMRAQALQFGAGILSGEVRVLSCQDELFVAKSSVGTVKSKTVLLATGVVNRRPAMPDDIHAAALGEGLLRYCPICDGYEVTDRSVAVLGTGERGCAEAEFLRAFTRDVTLVAPEGRHQLTKDQAARLADAGIRLLDGPCLGFELGSGDALTIGTPAGRYDFACLYAALGTDIRSELAAGLGAEVSSEGCPVLDAHQRSTVPGLYVAGDLALGLDQISNAMGQAAVAATAIRNDLAAKEPLRR